MKFKFLLILAFSLAGMQLLKGQDFNGIVYESLSKSKKAPLPGANIYWAGTQEGTVSGVDGKFTISQDEHGHSNLVFSFVGYEKDTVHVHDFDPNHMLEVTLALNKTLKEIEITGIAKGSVIDRMNPILTQSLNDNEFRKAACCNLSESFETNASVDVSYSDAVSGAKQIQLLGLAGIYSQMMTENIPNLQGLARTYGLEYIPGSWMESIQISKGTSSVKNGYESITGQINVEYKKPHNSEKLYLNAYTNSFGKVEGNFNTAFKLNHNWSTMLMGHAEDMSGEIDLNDDSFLDIPKVRQYHFFNRWKYEKHGKIHAQFGIKALDEERTGGQVFFNEQQPRDTSNGYGINIQTRRYEAFAKSGFILNRPETNIGIIQSLIYHDQHSFFGLNDYDAEEISYYGNAMFQSYFLNSHHHYTLGLSYEFDKYDEVLNDSSFARTESVPGAFIEYNYSIDEKLNIMAGFRADFHNLHGTLLTPRLHLRYAPNENWIFRASAGKGYRSPNLFAENSFILATSKRLVIQDEPQMEEAWNYGLNFTNYTDILGKQLMVNVDFYRTDFVNQLIVDMDQDIYEVNVYNLDGRSFSNSFQVEASYELLPRLEMTAAYRYNDVQITLNNKLQRKPLVNRYKGLLNLSYTTKTSGWQFDFTAQLNGDARLPETAEYPEKYHKTELTEEYTILNAQITKYAGNWEFYAGGENLGDFTQEDPIIAADDPFGEYFDTSLVWGPIVGRKFYVGLRYSIPFKKEKHEH